MQRHVDTKGVTITCVRLLQRLVGEEAQPSIGNNTQHGGSKASIQRLQALFSGYPHKHVQDVAVPKHQEEPKTRVYSTINLLYRMCLFHLIM